MHPPPGRTLYFQQAALHIIDRHHDRSSILEDADITVSVKDCLQDTRPIYITTPET